MVNTTSTNVNGIDLPIKRKVFTVAQKANLILWCTPVTYLQPSDV